MRSPARLLAPLARVVAAAALVGCSATPTPDPQPTIPPGITAPPPTLDQHTDEVLGELGFTDAEVATLRASGVAGAAGS